MTNFNRLSSQFSLFHSTKSLQPETLQPKTLQPKALEQRAQPACTATKSLEQIWNLPSTNRTGRGAAVQQSGADVLKRMGKWLVAFLTGEQHIRIWTTYSKAGVVWHVYDPVSDRHSSHASENELRSWLEQRHHS